MKTHTHRMKVLWLLALILTAVIPAENSFGLTLGDAGIIPKPLETQDAPGSFALTPATMIIVPENDRDLKEIALLFSDIVYELGGFHLEVRSEPRDTAEGMITLSTKGSPDLGDEGHTITVSADAVSLDAQKPAGVFLATQTIRQILMTASLDNRTFMQIPCGTIKDKPAFAWRGFQMDSSRQFMTIDFAKRYIDLLALHKMNVFHWHFTDDQGWRLEIKQYPNLTSDGAWRGEKGHRRGGYHTQDEVREVIEYARRRYIDVIPEIEMPGHATAAIAAYPELSCEGEKIPVETVWGIHKNLFCAGKEETFVFLENVLTEVAELFPSQYIHIGGDEAQKDKWNKCPLCQKRIKDEGLDNSEELQGYFTKRIDTFIQSLGKTMIGWDEILEGGASQTAIVQSWRGMEGAIEGASHGHYVISSPAVYTYFDFPNVNERVHDDQGWLRELTIEKMYSFNPMPDELNDDQKKYILGGEAPLFSERTPQPEVDNNVFPRFSAFSEVVWRNKADRSWPDFAGRLEIHKKRLEMLDVDYYQPSTVVGTWKNGQVPAEGITLEWDITDHISAGRSRITVRHDEGENRVLIEKAVLIEDGVEVAQDIHDGFSGLHQAQMNYRLDIPQIKRDAKYTVRVTMRSDGGTDTKGSILIRSFDLK